MSEPAKNPFDMLLDQIREVVRQELKAVLQNSNGKSAAEKEWMKAKELAELYGLPRTWFEERGRAGEICSALLEGHLWLILDRSFGPKDGLAIYYPEDLAVLKTKSPEELREIHKAKLAYPGCRVIQEGPESKL